MVPDQISSTIVLYYQHPLPEMLRVLGFLSRVHALLDLGTLLACDFAVSDERREISATTLKCRSSPYER